MPNFQIVNWPMYLFFRDSPELVHKQNLISITRALIRIVNQIRDQSAASMRQQMRQE